MNNYLSIGVDAKIALEFHRKREEFFARKENNFTSLKNQLYFLSPRSRNHVWYAKFGAKEVLEHSCKGLEKQIVLIVSTPSV
jgi:diacylglycerol kinase (ATP)